MADMFETPWQDIVFSLGNFIFFLALLPSIFSTEKPAFGTSLVTAAFLSVFVYAFITLDLWLSASGTACAATGWWILAAQSFMKLRKLEKE